MSEPNDLLVLSYNNFNVVLGRLTGVNCKATGSLAKPRGLTGGEDTMVLSLHHHKKPNPEDWLHLMPIEAKALFSYVFCSITSILFFKTAHFHSALLPLHKTHGGNTQISLVLYQTTFTGCKNISIYCIRVKYTHFSMPLSLFFQPVIKTQDCWTLAINL